MEPMPKIDVVVGAVCDCGTLASKNNIIKQFKSVPKG
jgi:hypothetical protein